MIARLARIGGRVLLAALFILAGIAKVLDGAPFLAHMAEHGVPGLLLPAVIVLEIGAGIAVLLGWRLMISAGALGVFCLLTALLFHTNLGDHVERTMFFKDIAIGGGLFVLAATRRRATRIEDTILAWAPPGLGLRREVP